MSPQLFILSADDDADDQELIQEALLQVNISCDFRKTSNGQKLLDLLQELQLNRERLPDVILLDLNMPVISGREALLQIRNKRSPFASIPVIILSTSSAPEDVQFCLQHGAGKFLVKPTSFGTLGKMLKESFSELCGEIIS